MKTLALVPMVLLALATPAPARPRHDITVRAADFRCLTDGAQVEGKLFRVFHKSKRKLRRALEVARARATNQQFPPGTILQVFPFEAMVKHRRGFNPDGGDWEFLKLQPTASGATEIVAQGKAEVTNVAGSCQGCHARIATQNDFVCEYVIGPVALGFTADQILAGQAADPRCTAAGRR